MKLGRFLLSLLAACWLTGLVGCDVAVVALLASKGSSKSSSSTPAGPDLSFALYVANFASAGAAITEAGVLDSNGGNPSLATWSFVGRGTATQIWSGIPAGKNAALIQGPLNQIYNIDAFERLNANGAVVEVPTSTNVYSNSAVSTSLLPATGMVDGAAVVTKISDPTHLPCVFALFSQSISSLRVRIWGTDQISGDCVWSNHHELANTDNFVVGGAVAFSSGTVYTTFVDTTLGQSWLISYLADGSKNSPVNVIAANASTTSSMGAAVDTSGNVYIASSLATGQIQLQKYAGGSATATWTTFFTGTGSNHIGPGGLSVASNVSLAGGGTGTAILFAGGQGTTGTHSIVRYDDAGLGASYVWGPITLADPSSNPTDWASVFAIGPSAILTTGNLSNTTSGNIEIVTQSSTLATGSLVWPSPITSTGGGSSSNKGNAICADSAGFAYVAGNFGSVANGKDSILLRYNVSDGSGLATLYQNSTFTGPNEFLGAVADTDGTTYVVGYITQSDLISTTASGAITSMWIGRFPPAGVIPDWVATFNAGTGNDQAISVSLSGIYVYVVGQNALPGPKNGMRIFKFLK